MSRYLQIEVRAGLDEVAGALSSLAIAHERAADRVILRGGLECAGDPVDVRIAARDAETAMDVGFVEDDGRVRLVCGDVDRARGEQLLDRVHAEVARMRVSAAATTAGLAGDECVEADGARRIVLRRR